MKDNQKESQKDIHLDIPAEANHEKHINFRDSEAEETADHNREDQLTERQKEWKEGLAEGERARREKNP